MTKNKRRSLVSAVWIERLAPYAIITIIGLIVCLPLIKDSGISGHDSLFHAYRIPSTANSLKDGQVVPQVDPEALGGFGYSWNMFYGPLSSYISTLLRVVTPDWFTAINIFIILSTIASGIFIYRFVKEVTNRKLPALFSSILYIAAPYHLLDVFIRQAQGELLPFVFAPLLFHGLYRLVHQQKGGILIGVGFAGILLSHNISALIFGVFAALYLLFNLFKIINFSALKQILICGLLALGLTAFFVFPLAELKFTNLYSVFDNSYMEKIMGANASSMNANALTAGRLFFNPVTITGEGSPNMPFSLGVVTFIGLALLPLGYRKMTSTMRRFTIQILILSLISLVLVTEFIDWSIAPHLIYTIQFPWRFLMASTMFLSVVGGVSIFYALHDIFKKRQDAQLGIIFVSILAVYSSSGILSLATYSNVPKVGYDYSLNDAASLREQWIDQYSPKQLYGPNPTSTPQERYIPLIRKTLIAQPHVPVVKSGDANTSNFNKHGTKSSFTISTDEVSSVELPYIYYPGYKAYVETGDKITHLKTSVSSEGFVLLTIPAHTSGKVCTYFGLSVATIVGSIATATTVLLLGVYTFIRYRTAKTTGQKK